MTYPIQGCVDGVRGDHILIAPPFTITTGMIHMLVSGLERAIGELERTHTAGAESISAGLSAVSMGAAIGDACFL